MVRGIVEDLQKEKAASIISRKFHDSVVSAFSEIVSCVRDEHELNTVALSGGCFQNAYLLSEMENRLADKGFRVLSHKRIPTNDGGVALGQVCIANAMKRD
jgi:hydrogenase maturation protein HypF